MPAAGQGVNLFRFAVHLREEPVLREFEEPLSGRCVTGHSST